MIAIVLGGAVGALVGYGAGMAGSMLVMGRLGVSDFEGKRATASAFLFGPVGALAGIVLGCWLAQTFAGDGASLGATLRGVGLTVVALLVLGGAWVAMTWFRTDQPVVRNAAPPRLAFEFRVPAARGFPAAAGATLDTDSNRMPATMKPGSPSTDGDWSVLAGEVEIYYRATWRRLVLDLGGGRQLLFDPGLPRVPAKSTDWSAWRRAEGVFSAPGQTTAGAPGPDDVVEMRGRVVAT
ncbi:MAG: hypothetical protein IPK81_18910 [Rhodospirillales bacterium]|nr:MAG: hypothetical protein IPK81_18910 [Rhodospirillales bacterium]